MIRDADEPSRIPLRERVEDEAEMWTVRRKMRDVGVSRRPEKGHDRREPETDAYRGHRPEGRHGGVIILATTPQRCCSVRPPRRGRNLPAAITGTSTPARSPGESSSRFRQNATLNSRSRFQEKGATEVDRRGGNSPRLRADAIDNPVLRSKSSNPPRRAVRAAKSIVAISRPSE